MGAGACAHAQLDVLPYCMNACKKQCNQETMQSYMLVAIQYSQAAAQAEQYLQYSVGSIHRRLSKITMSTCIIWACARVNTSSATGQGCCTAKLWRACSWDFTRVAVYLVAQMDLSRWKAVCCGHLTFQWSLDRWQRQSRLANHAITHEPSLKSKI